MSTTDFHGVIVDKAKCQIIRYTMEMESEQPNVSSRGQAIFPSNNVFQFVV